MRSIYFIALIMFIACAKKISSDDLTYLNGYWEIDTVTFPDGNTKEYKANISIDYIEINGLKGFKKKVQPKLDGSFTTTNSTDQFTIIESNGLFKMYYKTDLSEWEEQLIEISEASFTLRNKENLIYNYKRYTPINIEE